MAERTHIGMRSLRCGSHDSSETRTETSDRLLLTRQHSAFDQDGQTRVWIDTAEGLASESARLDGLLIGPQPRAGNGPQSGIGGFHPAKLYLLKQLGERVGLGDGGNRTLQKLFA